jgi:hypothetical protein
MRIVTENPGSGFRVPVSGKPRPIPDAESDEKTRPNHALTKSLKPDDPLYTEGRWIFVPAGDDEAGKTAVYELCT